MYRKNLKMAFFGAVKIHKWQKNLHLHIIIKFYSPLRSVHNVNDLLTFQQHIEGFGCR